MNELNNKTYDTRFIKQHKKIECLHPLFKKAFDYLKSTDSLKWKMVSMNWMVYARCRYETHKNTSTLQEDAVKEKRLSYTKILDKADKQLHIPKRVGFIFEKQCIKSPQTRQSPPLPHPDLPCPSYPGLKKLFKLFLAIKEQLVFMKKRAYLIYFVSASKHI